MRDIGKNIKDLRIRRKMTQDQLAEKLFVTRQTVSNYETGKSQPDIDMLESIAQTLDVDIRQVIYGPEKPGGDGELTRLITGSLLCALFGVLWAVLLPYAQGLGQTIYSHGMYTVVAGLLRPLCFVCCGWTVAQMLAMALKKKPVANRWLQYTGWVLLAVSACCLLLAVWWVCAVMLNEWLFMNHIRGEWITVDGANGMGWSMLPPPVPEWVQWCGQRIAIMSMRYPWIFPLWGVVLWVCGIPPRKSGTSNPPRDK